MRASPTALTAVEQYGYVNLPNRIRQADSRADEQPGSMHQAPQTGDDLRLARRTTPGAAWDQKGRADAPCNGCPILRRRLLPSDARSRIEAVYTMPTAR